MRAKWKKKRKGPEDNSFLMMEDGKASPPPTPPYQTSGECRYYPTHHQVMEGQPRPGEVMSEVMSAHNFSHPDPEDTRTPPPAKDSKEPECNISPLNASSGYGSEGSSPDCSSQMSPNESTTSCLTPPTPRSLLSHWGRSALANTYSNAFQYSATWQAFSSQNMAMLPHHGVQGDQGVHAMSGYHHATGGLFDNMYATPGHDKAFHN